MGRASWSRLTLAAIVACVPAAHLVLSATGEQAGEAQDARRGSSAPLTGARDPAWSADGSSIAFSLLDQIWIATREGQAARPLVTWDAGAPAIERDPAWSPDGRWIAFAADRGDGFDIYVVAATGGRPERLSFQPGPERWPSWTPDGRVVFAHRSADQWDLVRALPASGTSVAPVPEPLTETPFDETEPSVSPDGQQVLFVSTRDSDGGDPDLWVMPLATAAERSTSGGDESSPATTTTTNGVSAASPSSTVSPASSPASPTTSTSPASSTSPPSSTSPASPSAPSSTTSISPASQASVPAATAAKGVSRMPTRVVRVRGAESSPVWAPDGRRIAFSAIRQGLGSIWVADVDRPGDQATRPAAPPFLVSRRGGQIAWSPDGRQLLVSDAPDPEPTYNGNPRRDAGEAPPLFALGRQFNLRLLPAPRPPDDGEVTVSARLSVPPARWLSAFDQVWRTLRDLYYREGSSASAWQALRDVYAPRAAAARDDVALETVIDAMIAEQPLIKPAVVSPHAVVVSGHRLASEAGVRVLERGGNVVDAAIAVAFALGVVEPDASGIGGDGMAVLFLKGMTEPVVIEYKDQTPIHATLDNPAIFRDGRLVGDGPAAANIPGVVAGLDMLFQKYGSKRVPWEDLIAPAIRHAEEGYVLDEALPTSIAEGQSFLRKYEAARAIFLPGGRVPRAGERFVNRDYAATLHAIAKGGAKEFYQGAIARRIAADMTENGGIIGYEDLAQYRAVERQPLVGRFRDHVIYAAPPPVSSGASLIESLQILDHYAAAAGTSSARDADYFHYVVEAWKLRHPMTQIADPALWPVSLGQHLDRAHAGTLFQQIDPARASSLRADPGGRDEAGSGGAAGNGNGSGNGNDSGNGNGNGGGSGNGGGNGNEGGNGSGDGSGDDDRLGRGTTAFVVADADGNMIAVTQTLSTWGGSFYVSKGLGFLYNNHLRSSRVSRGAFGQLLPLTRSSSTSTPTLLFRDVNGAKLPRLAVGAAGNAWIVASVYSIITQVIDGGQSMQAAVEAPRFLIGRDPADPAGTTARVQIEDRFPRAVLADLMRRGHVFQKIGRKGEVRYGYASGALVDVPARRVEGGADPRRSHTAMAWGGTTASQ